MTTLAALVAEIEDDLARSDVNTQIRSAITSAINHYQQERFFFSETRSASFDTVADQSAYTPEDDEDLQPFLDLDAVFLADSDDNRFELSPADPTELHWLLGDGASTGRPYCYAYYNQDFVLYPIPDDVYTITPMGHVEIRAPISDDEADNPWMTKAYELIRCRAEAYLFLHVIKDTNQASMAGAGEGQALSALRSKTTRKLRSGGIVPTSF